MPSLERRVSISRDAVASRRRQRSLNELERAAAELAPIRPFTEWIGGEEIAFVVRVKAGGEQLVELAEQTDVAGLAAELGVLGSLAEHTTLPLLLTDLVVDGYQLYECRLAGAGGVILVAAAFEGGDRQLEQLHGLAASLGLDVIVEVAEEDEIEHVLELLDPDSFLVRNRDVEGAGEIDFERTFSLLEEVPAGKIVVSQGGIRTRDEVIGLERAGVDAAILGPWVVEAGLVETLDVLSGDARHR